MTDLSDFFPVFSRSEADIRADYDVRANAGLTPDDPDWVDTRQGSQFQFCSQMSVIENAQVYDRLNEILAAAILATSWGEYLDLHAASYGDERIAASYAIGTVTFTGTNGTLVASGVRVSPPQTDPEVDPPIFETTDSGVIAGGTLDLPVRALEPGAEGNVGVGLVTFFQSAVEDVTAVTNADAFGGGADVETDESLKKRLQLAFKGGASANWPGYVREVLRWPGVGYATVEPHFAGPGTVRVNIRDDEGDPVNPLIVDALQEYLDPDPGLGHGWAPINHVVTVVTPVAVPVHASATLLLEDGFALEDVALPVTDAYNAYIASLEPGEDVVFNHVLGAIVTADEGVRDVTALTLDTVEPPVAVTDLAIAAGQIAQPGNLTLA